MSKHEPRSDGSASGTSSGEIPPLQTSLAIDPSSSDFEGSKSARTRGSSLSKPPSQSARNLKQSRRRSDQIESRHRSSPTLDTSKATLAPIEDVPESNEPQAHTPYGFVTSIEPARGDASFLSSTLQSINRLKEEKEFVIDEGVLKGGSLTAIVLCLIEEADRQSILAFLACLPRYGLPEQLLQLLVDKYPPKHAHYDDMHPFLHLFTQSSKLENSQAWMENATPTEEKAVSGVLNFFAIWVDSYFKRDFQRTGCLSKTENFLSEILSAGFEDWHRRCKLIIIRRVGYEPRSQLFTTPQAEDPKASKKGKRLSTKKRSRANSVADGEACFDTLTAADIAEQLTLREWEIFRVIPESEFLEKTWLSKPIPTNSPLCQMIDHFNVISLWVASEIVTVEDLKDRANALKKMISVCDLLFELGNFNGLMEVVAGLTMGCVQRLHRTWSLAGSGPKATYEKFSHIMTTKQNFQTYRHALSTTKLPAVPYLGVFLRDIVFIEEGNPLRLPNGFFNFDRISLLGRLIMDVQKYKHISYDIPVMPTVQTFFANLKPLDNDDALYEASMAAENEHTDASAPT